MHVLSESLIYMHSNNIQSNTRFLQKIVIIGRKCDLRNNKTRLSSFYTLIKYKARKFIMVIELSGVQFGLKSCA